ncbi:MAG: hypothetical protein LBJ67_11370 [Planctomycetaceae bacterium]|jgi:hypothetical protein|nr:hypothetical protein [Planctomycetaceae bacterium]
MLNEVDCQQELLSRLNENQLEDTDDLNAYIQYASRLAALGNDTEINKLPDIFNKPPFAGNIPEILKTRCEQGIWEVMEYSGDGLALSLIDAQDFHCFFQRFEQEYGNIPVTIPLGTAPLRIFFNEWQEVCENAELDEDAAEMLQNFLQVYPIPENERLPVVNTPITQWEYGMLHALRSKKKFPCYELHWNLKLKPSMRADWQKAGKTGTPKLAWCAAATDNKPSETQINLVGAFCEWQPLNKTIKIERTLYENWDLLLRFSYDNKTAPAIDRVRLEYVPAFQDEKQPSDWIVSLAMFPYCEQIRLLDECPVIVHFTQGFDAKIILPS